MQARNPKTELVDALLTPNQQKIVDILARAYPRRLHTETLINTLYEDDPNGGPETAIQVVRVQIFHIRKKLATHGWTIPHNKVGRGQGNYCFYSLSPITTH